MYKILYPLFIGFVLSACASDGFNDFNRNVVDENENLINLEELLLLINVKASDSTYLVVSSIDSVNIFVNNFYWNKLNSAQVDTSRVPKTEIDNRYHSSEKVNYLLVATHDLEEPEFETAGEIAEYLNSINQLEPGEYACFIESFSVTYNDGQTETFKPFSYSTFKVEPDTRSASVGEIELKIY